MSYFSHWLTFSEKKTKGLSLPEALPPFSRALWSILQHQERVLISDQSLLWFHHTGGQSVNGVLTVGHVEMTCGPVIFSWLCANALISCPCCVPSACVAAWYSAHTARRPTDYGAICLGGRFGPCRSANALCRKYYAPLCRRKAINVLLSSVILGKLKHGDVPFKCQLMAFYDAFFW